jgi:hypothetical protein
MKYRLSIIFTLFIIFFTTKIHSQDLTGTWEGLYGIGTKYVNDDGMNYRFDKDSVYIHLELKQNGRQVEGLLYFAYTDSKHDHIATCSFSGLLDKKNPLKFFLLHRERIFQNDIDPKTRIRLFSSLLVTYNKTGDIEMLTGNWRTGTWNGVFWVKKKTSFLVP